MGDITDNYLGVPGAQFIWNGSWSDPMIAYKGFQYNYWDFCEDLEYRYEDADYDEWWDTHPDELRNALECFFIDCSPQQVDDWLFDDLEWADELDKLVNTLESWKTKTDIPEAQLNEWIEACKKRINDLKEVSQEDLDFYWDTEDEYLADIKDSIEDSLNDSDKWYKWFEW